MKHKIRSKANPNVIYIIDDEQEMDVSFSSNCVTSFSMTSRNMKKKPKISEDLIMLQRFAPTQVLDLSFSDGANNVEKPGKTKRPTAKTTIENTKPKL